MVTDTLGGVYVFGGLTKFDPANESVASQFIGDDENQTPYCADEIHTWNLSKISDIHGNTAEITYRQDVDNSHCVQTMGIYPEEVKYNYDENSQRYLSVVDFEYRSTEGYDSYIYDDQSGRHYGSYLSSIIIKNDNNIISRYDLNYTYSYKNNQWTGGDDAKSARRLLTSISKKGLNGQGNERPYTFCYKSLYLPTNPEVCHGTNTSTEQVGYTPNDIYLTKSDNGYGGILSYTYEKRDKIDRICSNREGSKDDWGDNRGQFQRVCTDTSGFMPNGWNRDFKTSFYLVTKIRGENGMGQIKLTEYNYLGQSLAYGQNLDKFNGHWSPRIIGGLQFFGYSAVQTKVTDGNSKKMLAYTESRTINSSEFGETTRDERGMGSCFMPHPQKGMVNELLILNESGATIGKTDKIFIIRPELKCEPRRTDWGKYEVFQKESISQIDGKKSKSETFYDFEAYPNDSKRNFGNVVKTIEHGNPDIQGDELYSYLVYLQDGIVANGFNMDPYFQKNLISIVWGSLQSDVNIDILNMSSNLVKIPEPRRYNWTIKTYDERIAQWGYQAGISGVKGLPSKEDNYIVGKSIDAPNEKFIISTQLDYDKYGLLVKQTAPNGAVSTTYYDDTYHQYPICQVSWKVDKNDSLISQPKEQACDYNNNKDKKIISKSIFNSTTSLARGLVDKMQDANGATSRNEYDEYGRVIKYYQPNKDTGQPETTYISQSQYFDDQTPMRTRTRTRLNTDSKETYQTVDEFFDGFGNKTQTIKYDLEDSQGKYAVLSTQYFNGIGQVEETIEGLPIRNLNITSIPQLISQTIIDNQKQLATKTNTAYDFFSRPTTSITTTGGLYGDPIITTSRTMYEGYKVHSFNNAGNQTTIEVLGLKTTSTNYLCSQDRSCTSSNGQAVTTETINNILGKTISTKDARGVVVKETVYNSAGMPLLEKDLDRGLISYYYDNFARLQQVKDAGGNISKSSQFDILNRVTQSQLFQSGKTISDSTIETVYDTQYIGKANEMRMQKDGAWLQKQTITYDLLGKPKETIDQYDLSRLGIGEGQVITKKNSTTSTTGLPLTSQYAVNNNILDNITYQYDDVGKLKSATDGLSNNLPLVKDLAYDYKGSLLSLAYDNNTQAVNEYDNSGRTKKKTIKSGADILFSQTSNFDPTTTQLLTLINTQSKKSPVFTTQIKYDSFGRLATISGNEYSGVYEFDKVNNLLVKKETEISVAKVPVPTIAMPTPKKITPTPKSVIISPRDDDRRRPIVIPVTQSPKMRPTSSVSVLGMSIEKKNNNDIGRLIAGIEEPKNNLLQPISGKIEDVRNIFFTDGYVNGVTNPCDTDTQYKQITKYDASKNSCPYHAAKQSTINGQVRIYLYDKRGNLISEFSSDGKKIRDFVYDAANLPIKIVDYDTNGSIKLQEEYAYGIGGARLAKIDTKTKNYNLYLGSYEKKKDLTGITESVNVDVPLAAIIKVKKGSGAWVKNYTHANYQGSTAFILDAGGKYLPEFQNGANYFRYFAYGGQINNVNIATLPRENTYTGQKKDISTGLMYYNARYYNPATGLFQQADSANDGLNKYAYVAGNPVMNTDPSGNICVFGFGSCFSYDKEQYKRMGYSSISAVGGYGAKYNKLTSEELDNINYAQTFFPKEKVDGIMVSDIYKKSNGSGLNIPGRAAVSSDINNIIYLNLNNNYNLSLSGSDIIISGSHRLDSAQKQIENIVHETIHIFQWQSLNNYEFSGQDVSMKTIKQAVTGKNDSSEYSLRNFANLALKSGVSYEAMTDSSNQLSNKNIIYNPLTLPKNLSGLVDDYGLSNMMEFGAKLGEAYSNIGNKAEDFKKKWPEMYTFVGNAYFGGKEFINK